MITLELIQQTPAEKIQPLVTDCLAKKLKVNTTAHYLLPFQISQCLTAYLSHTVLDRDEREDNKDLMLIVPKALGLLGTVRRLETAITQKDYGTTWAAICREIAALPEIVEYAQEIVGSDKIH